MFTGLIGAVGAIRAVHSSDLGRNLDIAAPWSDIDIGESISVDGACLTVTAARSGMFSAHVVATTLERTTLGGLEIGTMVNLERAVRFGDRLGGHLVQGHVDGVGRVVATLDRGGERLIDIAVPATVAAVSIPLGSICVAGVSMTVNARPGPEIVQVAVVPFTLGATTLGQCMPGDLVNLEGDLVGKHIQGQAEVWRMNQEAG